MNSYESVLAGMREAPSRWLVTGVAGFIGSNLLQTLLEHDQCVVGLDNFSTGFRRNLEQVRDHITAEQWKRFSFIEGDIRDEAACRRACEDVEYVLHQAALGSVPRSVKDPVTSNNVNINGFLNMLSAARGGKVKRFVYASSSSVYGDCPDLPKREEHIGNPLSPYALTKQANELYARVFEQCYGTKSIGLRYFNVFGPRQDPDGTYAAVIPKWVAAMIRGEQIQINGDGETSRDFCYVGNVVQANVLAATASNAEAVNQVYNVAVGERTTLNQLFEHLRDRLVKHCAHLNNYKPLHSEFRIGDVRHSLADISKARRLLGYRPSHSLIQGIAETLAWYVDSAVPLAAKCGKIPQDLSPALR